MSRKTGALAALAAMVVIAGAASADQVDMRFMSVGAGRAVSVQYWIGSTKVLDTQTFAGSLNHEFRSTTAGGTNAVGASSLATFCVDILESVDSRWRTMEVRDLGSVPVDENQLTGTFADSRVQRLGQLYNYGMMNGLLNAGGGWANGDVGNTAAGNTNRDQAAAWQLLVWELAFGDADVSNWDEAGALRVAGVSASVRNFFSTFRDAARNVDALTGLRAASRGRVQDQLVVIPLPPAAYAGMGLLGAVIGVSYIRRRSLKTA